MPFTFTHPAAVLPLALIPKRWLSVTGMVIGSITPDFEYFFNMKQDSIYSHTWAGVLWFDLPLALILVYLYDSLIKKSIIENLPQFLNRRFSGFETTSRNLNKVKRFCNCCFFPANWYSVSYNMGQAYSQNCSSHR